MHIRKGNMGSRKRDITPKTMMSTIVEHARESNKHRKLPLNCTFYEPKSKEAKNTTVADTMTFKRVLNSENRLFSVLPEDSSLLKHLMEQYQRKLIVISVVTKKKIRKCSVQAFWIQQPKSSIVT